MSAEDHQSSSNRTFLSAITKILAVTSSGTVLIAFINLVSSVLIGRMLGVKEYSAYVSVINAVVISSMFFKGIQADVFLATVPYKQSVAFSSHTLQSRRTRTLKDTRLVTPYVAVLGVAVTVLNFLSGAKMFLILPALLVGISLLLMMVMIGSLQAGANYALPTIALLFSSGLQVPLLIILQLVGLGNSAFEIILIMSFPSFLTYVAFLGHLRRFVAELDNRPLRSRLVSVSPAMWVGLCSNLPGLFLRRVFNEGIINTGALFILVFSSLSGIAQMIGALLRSQMQSADHALPHQRRHSLTMILSLSLVLSAAGYIFLLVFGDLTSNLMFHSSLAASTESVAILTVGTLPWIAANILVWFHLGEIGVGVSRVFGALSMVTLAIMTFSPTYSIAFAAYGVIGLILSFVLATPQRNQLP